MKCKKIVLLIMAISLSAYANVGIVKSIYDVEAKMISEASRVSAIRIIDSLKNDIENIYDLNDNDGAYSNINFRMSKSLKNAVDTIYKDNALKAKIGTAEALGSIQNINKVSALTSFLKLENEDKIKLIIQDIIVQKWIDSGIINPDNETFFDAQNAYTIQKEESFFGLIKKYSLTSDLSAGTIYKNISFNVAFNYNTPIEATVGSQIKFGSQPITTDQNLIKNEENVAFLGDPNQLGNIKNSNNQELLTTVPQTNSDTSYAGDYSLSWGGNITDHFGSGPFETSPDGAAPKRGVSLVFLGGAISQTKLLTQSKATYFGDYNYVAWGRWDGTSVESDPGGGSGGIPFKAFWVATELTTLPTQPKTGTATYNGEVQGVLSYDTPLGGTIALNANFGTNALTGTMNITKVSDGSTWKTTTFNTSIITEGDGEHLRFETKLNGNNVVNNTNTYKDSKIMGSFAGTQAAEVGGTWNITTTDDKVAVGAFRAKKQ